MAQETPATKRFGKEITKAREKAGLTRPQLAEKIGTTESSVYKWEHGQRTPGADLVQSLNAALGVSLKAPEPDTKKAPSKAPKARAKKDPTGAAAKSSTKPTAEAAAAPAPARKRGRPRKAVAASAAPAPARKRGRPRKAVAASAAPAPARKRGRPRKAVAASAAPAPARETKKAPATTGRRPVLVEITSDGPRIWDANGDIPYIMIDSDRLRRAGERSRYVGELMRAAIQLPPGMMEQIAERIVAVQVEEVPV